MKEDGNERVDILGREFAHCLNLVDLTLQPVKPSLPLERRNRNLDGGQFLQTERSAAARAPGRSLCRLPKPFRREKVEAQKIVGGRARIGEAGEKAVRSHSAMVRLPCDAIRVFVT